MELGAFSVSLSVSDLEASKSFYEKLGFSMVGGDALKHWLIMRNGDCTLGLFHGMFEKNILTFNPGWSKFGEALDSFTDVRKLQQALRDQGVEIINEADEKTTGPESFIVVDPDGNPVLVDQHV